MGTRVALLTAALKVLEDEGEAQFSTRTVCALANVTAQLRNTAPPTTDVLEDIRENAVSTILTPESKG